MTATKKEPPFKMQLSGSRERMAEIAALLASEPYCADVTLKAGKRKSQLVALVPQAQALAAMEAVGLP